MGLQMGQTESPCDHIKPKFFVTVLGERVEKVVLIGIIATCK